MKDTTKRNLLFALSVIFSVIFMEIYKAAVYLYNIALARSDKTFLAKLANLQNEAKTLYKDIEKEEENLINWLENTKTKYYNIGSYDNLILFGTVYLQDRFTDKWVILVHGYGGHGGMMNYAAKMFHEFGYNVVVPDCRGHGKSQGDYIGMGWHDRLDIISWAEKIIKGNKDCKIILYGVSMGGSSVLMASGEKLPQNIKCIISDSAYTSVYNVFSYQLKKMYKLPSFPFLNIVSCICKFRTGYFFREASTIKQLKKCKIPVLLIHGKNDDFVSVDMVYELYECANCFKDILVVKNSGHGIAAMIDKKNYWKKVYNFTKKHII